MDLQSLTVWIPCLLLAVTFHEAMHGYAANRLGDPTAKLMGRLTLNPIAHIDPLGTLIIPGILFLTHSGFLFGWAKPVPVNPFRLRNPKQDMMWVAAAGPVTNLTLAAISGVLFRVILLLGPLIPSGGVVFWNYLRELSIVSVQFNILLAVFNLIPLPPLDGGRILSGVLPNPQAMSLSRIEPYGMFVVILLIMLNPFGIMSGLWRIMDLLTRLFLGY